MDMAKLLQMMMAGGMGDMGGDFGNNGDSESKSNSGDPPPAADDSADFSSFFENIDFDMIMKMGELFSQMNAPDKNSALLTALKPHLNEEKHHKVDSAMKISRMISLLPLLKESGVLNKIF